MKKGKTVKSLKLELRKPLFVSPFMSLMELLNEFEKAGSHLAVVTSSETRITQNINTSTEYSLDQSLLKNLKAEVLGIVTLIDLVEHILQSQMNDEKDFDDKTGSLDPWKFLSFNHQKKPRAGSTTSQTSLDTYRKDRAFVIQTVLEDKRKEIVQSVLNDPKRLLGIVVKKEVPSISIFKSNLDNNSSQISQAQSANTPKDSLPGSRISIKDSQSITFSEASSIESPTNNKNSDANGNYKTIVVEYGNTIEESNDEYSQE